MKRILSYMFTFLITYGLALVAVKIFASTLEIATASPVGALACLITIGYIYWNEKKKRESEKENR